MNLSTDSHHPATDETLRQAMTAADRGDTTDALRQLRTLGDADKSPLALSYEAYCLASEIQVIKEALQMCRKALDEDPHNALIYLNIGRIYLVAGNEAKAALAFRRGVKHEAHPLLLRKLNVLVPRRRPLFPFLERGNPLNKLSGKLLARL